MTVQVRLIPERTILGRRLGRHVAHDPRSRDYPVQTTVPLRNVQWTRHVPIYDQGDTGSCTGQAMAGCLSTGPFTHHFREPTAVRLYKLATTLDDIPGQYPPDDTGSSGLAVMKAAQRRGYLSGYQHAFNVMQALQGLMLGPVITGTDWLTGMDQPDPDGRVRAIGDVRGGHEYCAVGVDVGARTVRFANSWGTAFGDAGYFEMTWDDWALLLGRDGDVTVPVR